MNALEDKYIAQLKEEAAAKSRSISARIWTSSRSARGPRSPSRRGTRPKPSASTRRRRSDGVQRIAGAPARRLPPHARHRQQQGRRGAVRQLQQTVALNEQAFAVQQNTKALNELTTSLHNAPEGYKVEADIYRFATPAQRPAQPGQWAVPTNPFRPPTTPLSPPAGLTADLATTLFRDPMRELSQELAALRGVIAPSSVPASRLAPSTTSSPGVSKTYHITFAPVIDGTKSSRTLAKDLAVEFKKVVAETLGPDADPADALGLLAP
jgi:hypothetical protein